MSRLHFLFTVASSNNHLTIHIFPPVSRSPAAITWFNSNSNNRILVKCIYFAVFSTNPLSVIHPVSSVHIKCPYQKKLVRTLCPNGHILVSVHIIT